MAIDTIRAWPLGNNLSGLAFESDGLLTVAAGLEQYYEYRLPALPAGIDSVVALHNPVSLILEGIWIYDSQSQPSSYRISVNSSWPILQEEELENGWIAIPPKPIPPDSHLLIRAGSPTRYALAIAKRIAFISFTSPGI